MFPSCCLAAKPPLPISHQLSKIQVNQTQVSGQMTHPVEMKFEFTRSNQISTARGFMNEKSLVGFPLGILKRMEMPRFMKGLVKSMTASRAKLMVMAPTARSALPSSSSESEGIMSKVSGIFPDLYKYI